MKNKIFSSAVLMSISGASLALYASDRIVNSYNFDEFDKSVFTNHTTQKVELVYPTPLIKLVSEEPVTVTQFDLKPLIYLALARIENRQSALALRSTSTLFNTLFSAGAQQVQDLWNKNDSHAIHLQYVYDRITSLLPLLEKSNPNVTLTKRAFMYVMQYAARKIEHHPGACVVCGALNDNTLKYCVTGEAYNLLKEHSPFEQIPFELISSELPQ